MKAKILVYVLLAFILTTIHLAEAQQPTKMARMGVLPAGSPASMATRVEAFRQALRELGYVEGRNIVLEYRYADAKYER
jgi:putative tryptophan/tyrosine transport system substrate-binding protein